MIGLDPSTSENLTVTWIILQGYDVVHLILGSI